MKTQDNSRGWPEGWLAAAAAAIFSAVMARVVGDLGLFATLMIAVFVFLVFGVLLAMFWGGPIGVAPAAAHGHAPAAPPQTASTREGTPRSADPARDEMPVEAQVTAAVPAMAAVSHAAEEAAPPPMAAQGELPEPAAAAHSTAVPDAVAMPEPAAMATDDGMAQAAVAEAPGAQALMADAAPVAERPDGDAAEQPSDSDDDETDAGGGAGAPRRTREERVAARAAKAARQAARAAKSEQAAAAPLPPTDAGPVDEPEPAAAPLPLTDAVPADDPQPAAAPLPLTDSVPAEDPQPALPAAPALEGGRKPQALAQARDGQPDKLQTIEGIGPVMEKLCHELGIFHFDQIAGWGEAEVAWMDGNLKGFKGRVTRDKWVRQAALIGEVGVDEFLRRAKLNEY